MSWSRVIDFREGIFGFSIGFTDDPFLNIVKHGEYISGVGFVAEKTGSRQQLRIRRPLGGLALFSNVTMRYRLLSPQSRYYINYDIQNVSSDTILFERGFINQEPQTSYTLLQELEMPLLSNGFTGEPTEFQTFELYTGCVFSPMILEQLEFNGEGDDPFLNPTPPLPVEHEGSDTCISVGNDNVEIGNPISLFNGEKRERATDIRLQTKQGSLDFSRSYRQSTQDDRDFMGRGWSHNHHIQLEEIPSQNKIIVDLANGKTIFYDTNNDNLFEASRGSSARIMKDTNGYTLSLPDSITYQFSLSGQLESHTMRDGQTWYYHYTNNQLTLVHDDANFDGVDETNIQWALRFVYYATSDFRDDKLWRVGLLETSNLSSATPSGDYVEFDYTELNGVGVFLTRVRDLLDYSQCYRYGFQEGETYTLLRTYMYRHLAIMSPGVTDCTSGDVIEISDTQYTLDANNKITNIVQALGDAERTSQIIFNSDNTMENVIGVPAKTHHLPNGVYMGMTDADGNKQIHTLSNEHKTTSQTDRNGNFHFNEWSEDGVQLKRSRDSVGNETRIRYDFLNRPIMSINPNNTTTLYDYEGVERQPVRTRLVRTRDENGRPFMLVDLHGYEVRTSWNEIGTPLVEEQRPPSYMEFGRYVEVANIGEGIESIPWDITADKTYTLKASIHVTAGSVTLQVPGVAGLSVTSSGTGLQTLDVSAVSASSLNGVKAQFISNSASDKFYVKSLEITEDDGNNVIPISVDGSRMSDNYWTDIVGAEPSYHVSIQDIRHSGVYTHYVNVNNANEGVENWYSDMVSGRRYYFSAYVLPLSGAVKLQLYSSSGEVDSVSTSGIGQWERLEISHLATSNDDITMRFVSEGGAAEFYFDTIRAYDGKMLLRQTERTYNSRRQVINNKVIDPSDGITVLKETEYCYDDDTCYGGSAPSRGLLWRTIIKEQGGLNDVLITNTYDDFGRVIQRQQNSQFGDCNTSYTVYDNKGQIVASICNYDPGSSAAPTNAIEAAALYASTGNPDKNQVTTYAYDALGRRISATTDAGTSFERLAYFVYNGLGQIILRVDNYNPLNSSQMTYMNPSNWNWNGHAWVDRTTGTSLQIEHGEDLDENIIIQTEYNDNSEVRLQRDVLGHAVLYGYNSVGQLIRKIINPIQNNYNNNYSGVSSDPSLANYIPDTTLTDADLVIDMIYDAVGNELMRTDSLGRRNFTQYDGLNRPIKRIMALKPDATIDLNIGDVSYDEENDPRSSNYVVSEQPDEDLITTMMYDVNGHLIRQQKLLENRDNGLEWDTTLFGYDLLGRQVRIIRHASQADYFDTLSDYAPDYALQSYQSDGNTDADLISDTVYDTLNRAYISLDVDGNETWQGFDGFNRPVQQVSHASSVGLLDPDYPNYVGDLTDPAQDMISKTEFNASGRVTKRRRVLRTNDAGTALEWLWTLYGYDTRGRVVKTIQNASDPSYPDNNSSDETLSGYVVSSNSDEDIVSETIYDAQGRVKKTVDHLGKVSLFGYDSANRRVVTITNVSNPTYDYEQNGDTKLLSYVSSTPDADQDQITRMTYDLAGRVVTTTDVANRVSYQVYDDLGRTTLRVTNYDNPDNGGQPTYNLPDSWSWNGTQWVDDVLSVNHGTKSDYNLVSQMVYDKGGQLVESRDVHGTVTGFSYDNAGRRVSVTQAQNTPLETRDYTCFDKAGRVRRHIRNVIGETDFDARINNSWVFTPRQHGKNEDSYIINETIYDRASRPVQRINPLGDVVETRYKKNGQVDTVTHKGVMVEDSLQDVVMLYRYDAMQRRKLVVQNYVAQGTDPADWVFDGNIWKTGVSGTAVEHDPSSTGNASQNIIVQANYDKSGRMVSLRDPNGHLTNYEYDQLGRRTKLTNPLGYDWLMTYEDIGQQTRVTMTNPGIEDISGVWQSYDVQQDYDRLGRLTQVSYPDADVTPTVSFDYDVSGNRTGMLETDSMATAVRETTYTYDAANRLIVMGLDRDGNSVVDESVTYAYDERGQRTQLTIDPNGDNLTISYSYDEKGRLVSLTDWDSQQTDYNYDGLNRHVATQHTNGMTSEYGYDAAGRLQKLTHSTATDTLSSFRYEVDARGNRIKMWESETSEFFLATYADRVTERGAWTASSNFYETVQWDARVKFDAPAVNGLQLIFGTGPDHSIFDVYIDGTLYQSYDGYSSTPDERAVNLDIRGNGITKHTIELRNRHEKNLQSSAHKLQFKEIRAGDGVQVDYTYDALARVLSADYKDSSRSYDYGYDMAGNRLQEAATIGITTTVTDWTYDDANRIATMQVGSNPLDTFGYDADGNLLSAGDYTYTWNHAGRMTTLDTGASIYHYTYDGDNNRLSQRLGTVTTDYLLDTQVGLAQVLRETDGTTTSHYVHGLRGIQNVKQATDWSVMLQDGLGTVRSQVDATAQTIATQNYSPYGQPFDTTGTWVGSYGYAGEQIDPTGLSYNRARYYDPALGTFTSLDPFEGLMSEPMTMNGYSYSNSNPVNMVDPSGEFANIFLGAAVGVAFGGSLGAVHGHTIYTFAAGGYCGCEGQQITQQTREEFARDLTTQGIIFGGAIGGVMGAGGPVAGLLGPVLTGIGLGNSLNNSMRVLNDWWGDWTIDNICPLVELAFDLVDALIGRALDGGFSNRNNAPSHTTGDSSPRNPDIVRGNLDGYLDVDGQQVGYWENADGSITLEDGRILGRGGGGSNNNLPQFPTNNSQIEHIFRDASGHVGSNPPESRQYWIDLWQDIVSNPNNIVENPIGRNFISDGAPVGMTSYALIHEQHGQVWVNVYNGIIRNAGVNYPESKYR